MKRILLLLAAVSVLACTDGARAPTGTTGYAPVHPPLGNVFTFSTFKFQTKDGWKCMTGASDSLVFDVSIPNSGSHGVHYSFGGVGGSTTDSSWVLTDTLPVPLDTLHQYRLPYGGGSLGNEGLAISFDAGSGAILPAVPKVKLDSVGIHSRVSWFSFYSGNVHFRVPADSIKLDASGATRFGSNLSCP